MDIFSRVNALVERAADTLAQLAHELRQAAEEPHRRPGAFAGLAGDRAAADGFTGDGLAGSPWDDHGGVPVGGSARVLGGGAGDDPARAAAGGPAGGPVGTGRPCTCGFRDGGGRQERGEPASRLRSFWEGVSMAQVMTFGELRIDLATAQGRWELLVLAVLLGARVTERVVERTFAKLRDVGLLDPRALTVSPESARDALRAVLQAEYRALGNKEGKADALVYNAKRLLEECRGDLHTLYLDAKAAPGSEPGDRGSPVDEEALIRSLQSFRHIKQLAFWVCRTLKAHGIWRDLSDRATAYHDRYTRLPLERLGLAAPGDDLLHAVGVMPLYLQGLNLCSQDDVKTCLAECPVAAWCPYPKGGAGAE